jgi:sterol 24-C-methyltransferase
VVFSSNLEAKMSSPDEQPLIKPNRSLQDYYASFESRIGYRLVLGGARHFGYWKEDTLWPFPIKKALRAMEDNLFDRLRLERGSLVLDAGCGAGLVALHLAKRGLRVSCIDVVDRHIGWAKKNVHSHGFDDTITVRKMDYHHLDGFTEGTFDGIYTMETFVHATDPEQALREFFRVLKPGGTIALYEYDHSNLSKAPEDIKSSIEIINKYASMPSNARFEQGVLERMMAEVGFEDIQVNDLSVNITPMLRLFFVLAFLPYLIVKLFGLEAIFINTVAAYKLYKSRDYCRYVAVSARKPSALKKNDGAGEGK